MGTLQVVFESMTVGKKFCWGEGLLRPRHVACLLHPELSLTVNLSPVIYRNYFQVRIRKYFFSQQMIKMWSSLPEDIVMATDTESFKRRQDRFMEDTSIRGY